MREDVQEHLEKMYPKGFFIVGLMANDRGDMLLFDRDGNHTLHELANFWHFLMDEDLKDPNVPPEGYGPDTADDI